MPSCRQTSATGVPPSACLSAYAICSSEYLERFIVLVSFGSSAVLRRTCEATLVQF
jgi:hypothetical protein